MIQKLSLVPLLTCLIGFNLLPGCRAADPSTVKLVGGGLAQNSFPSVVQLRIMKPNGDENCTGTFISDSTALTAAHCLLGGATRVVIENGISPFVIVEASTTDFATHPQAKGIKEIKPQDIWTDVAVVNFASGTSSATTQISTGMPQVENNVTLVGYGFTDQLRQEGLSTRKSGYTPDGQATSCREGTWILDS